MTFFLQLPADVGAEGEDGASSNGGKSDGVAFTKQQCPDEPFVSLGPAGEKR